jgi:hypothetical protein
MTPNKRMPPAAMLALALMGLPAGSQASTVTTQHGSDCDSYGWSSSADAYIYESGTWNFTNGPRSVVCPVTRVGPVSLLGMRVWIDGYAPSGSAVTCQLWSLNYNGVALATPWFNLTGTGTPFDRYLDLSQAQAPAYSSQVVICTLPPGGGIYDIEPVL